MNEEVVMALAEALGTPIPAERRAAIAAQLETQMGGGGGASADELEGVEPAIVFEPSWPA